MKKGEKFYLYKLTGSGRWTHYADALDKTTRQTLDLAVRYGYADEGNDAPRGGKCGDYIKITRSFVDAKLIKRWERESAAADRRAARESAELSKRLAAVAKSSTIDTFGTMSDAGSFLVDGKLVSNLYGDGWNTVEIRQVADIETWKAAEYISRAEAYGNVDINVCRFDSPRTVHIAAYDCAPADADTTVVNYCLGWCITPRKLRLYVKPIDNNLKKCYK